MSESYQSADIGMNDPAPAVALTPQRVKRNLSRHPGYVGAATDACTLIDGQAARVAELEAENARLAKRAKAANQRADGAEALARLARVRAEGAEADRSALRDKVFRLRIALHDAIRRPMGVTPDSAVEFYSAQMADEAEARRARPTAPATEQGEG